MSVGVIFVQSLYKVFYFHYVQDGKSNVIVNHNCSSYAFKISKLFLCTTECVSVTKIFLMTCSYFSGTLVIEMLVYILVISDKLNGLFSAHEYSSEN